MAVSGLVLLFNSDRILPVTTTAAFRYLNHDDASFMPKTPIHGKKYVL